MKTIPATILVFDSDSPVEDAKKYIGDDVYLYSGEDLEITELRCLESISIFKDHIEYLDDSGDTYENFAVIEY